MSKIIETLKQSAAELKKKTSSELTQQQLADIYFPEPGKLKKSEYPTVIKVTEKQKSYPIIPWFISGLAFFLFLFSLFVNKKVFIDVKVMNERASSLASHDDHKIAPDEILSAQADSAKIFLNFGDKLPLENFIFEGASRLKSSKSKSQLTLINSSVAPFARAILSFKEPVNLTNAKIVFYAKGNRGGENIAFSMKDNDNIPAFDKNKVYPFTNALTTDWQRAEVPAYNIAHGFDVRNVVSFRLEFGSKDTDNKPGDTILVKDLQVVPL